MAGKGFKRRVRPSFVNGVLSAQEGLQGADLQGENLVSLEPGHIPAGHHHRLDNAGIGLGHGLQKCAGENVGQGLRRERGPVVAISGKIELEDDRGHVGESVSVWGQHPLNR